MTDSMVERVARALYEQDSGRTDWDEATAVDEKYDDGFELIGKKRWRDMARAAIEATLAWRPMDTAPTDKQILVRRHNDCFWEYFVVWHSDEDEHYPWRTDDNSYPTDRLDGWRDIGPEYDAALGRGGE